MPQMPRQLGLPFEGRGEAPRVERSVETATATKGSGHLGSAELMETVLSRLNLKAALKRVKSNRGSPGIDGMTVEELPAYLRSHWPRLREELLAGTYQPQAVRRQQIPKSGGGVRELGIPTALDRFIQQALLQVLQPRFDPSFSSHSYGFRPGRSAHAAVKAARDYVQSGRRYVVDVDLEKFFDRVNHDVLMSRLACRIADRRVLRLIRCYLEAGVMANGVVMDRHEGTPQGGPLSPLLANVLLDEVDKELEEAWSRLRPICGRLQRVREQPPCGRTDDGADASALRPAPTPRQRGQERGRPGAETKDPRLLLLDRRGSNREAPGGAQGHRCAEEPDPYYYAALRGARYHAGRCRTTGVSARVVALFRPRGNPECLRRRGQVAAPPSPCPSLETVEAWPYCVPRNA